MLAHCTVTIEKLKIQYMKKEGGMTLMANEKQQLNTAGN